MSVSNINFNFLLKFDKNNLLQEADKCMLLGPFSVTHKTSLEFSQDPHDYVSGRIYWWKEGDSYVRRDGMANPIYRSAEFDRQRLEDFINSVVTLTLAHKYSDDQKYAVRATEYISTWFIEPATKMNPHLEFAQIVPNQTSTGLGVLDTYNFFYLVDAIDYLIEKKFISIKEKKLLKLWFKKFTHWLIYSEQAQKESRRKNNHGSSYDVQVVRYQLFLGRYVDAFWRLWRTKKRIEFQIDVNGLQPNEMDRTRSLFYHWFNLTKLIHLSELGKRLNLNLLHHKNKIRSALAYLLPYAISPDQWPYEQIDEVAAVDWLQAALIGVHQFNLISAVEAFDSAELEPSTIQLIPRTLFSLPYLLKS